MRLVSYIEPSGGASLPPIKLGALIDDVVVDLAVAQTWTQGACGLPAQELPEGMLGVLARWRDVLPHLGDITGALAGYDLATLRGSGRRPVARLRGEVWLLAPVPFPRSLRCFDGFEAHTQAVRARLGLEASSGGHEQPAFCFGNALAILGPEHRLLMPGHVTQLDYGLEVACVIGPGGQDIAPDEAPDHIAGLAIVNSWIARDIQAQELATCTGIGKSRDFATSLGPALVTPDELEDRGLGRGADLRYDLEMIARVNGQERSRGNLRDMDWTFSQMIAHASQGVELLPGEIICSGTVGGGSLIEAGARRGEEWLKPGDMVELEVEGLGVLRNMIAPSEYATSSSA
jgi:2-keto-4-pentenoate hydratase/2-oxohepta-3-ene-1,7-dioic acid hydratase in catechol pathway